MPAICQQCLINEKPYWAHAIPKITSSTYGLCSSCRIKLEAKEGINQVEALKDIFGIKK